MILFGNYVKYDYVSEEQAKEFLKTDLHAFIDKLCEKEGFFIRHTNTLGWKIAIPHMEEQRKDYKTMKELKDTVALMNSNDYKERFKAEYYQTKIRYEKLKAFNTKIEAADRTEYMAKCVEMPIHDCPAALLRDQQAHMGQYLHLLEVRAVIEGIEL